MNLISIIAITLGVNELNEEIIISPRHNYININNEYIQDSTEKKYNELLKLHHDKVEEYSGKLNALNQINKSLKDGYIYNDDEIDFFK